MAKKLKKVEYSNSSIFACAENHEAVEEWYEKVLETGVAIFSTGVQFNQLRVGLIRKEIAPFSFVYKGEAVEVGERAKMKWPEGLFKVEVDQLKIIISGKG